MQEFRVLQCTECQTLQVDIVKKDKKWSCKSCSQRQTVKIVYFKSHSGKKFRRWPVILMCFIILLKFHELVAKECRENVARLRQNGIETERQETDRRLNVEVTNLATASLTTRDSDNSDNSDTNPEQVVSKWLQFSRTKPFNKPQVVDKALHNEPCSEAKPKPLVGFKKDNNVLEPSNQRGSSTPCLSLNQNTHNSPYSIYHQPKPTQIYKLVDYHKKPSASSNPQAFSEPPQKKLKIFDDEDFFLDEDDLNALENLK